MIELTGSRFASERDIARNSVCCNVSDAVELLIRKGGYARLVENEADRQRLEGLCPDGGLVVGSRANGSVQVASGDSHSLIVGCSGRGKTRRGIIPMVETMILAGHNLVVNDMKGEIVGALAGLLKLMDYSVFVVNLRHPACSPDKYNPLSAAWKSWNSGDRDAASRMIRNLAFTIFSNSAEAHGVDPFWENSAQDYFTSLSLGMLEAKCDLEEFTLESVAAMDRDSMGYSRGRGPLDKFFSHMKGTIASAAAAGTLGAPEETKASILSVWRQDMSIYSSQEGLMSVLSYSNFDASVLAEKRTAIFLISPDEHSEIAPIAVAILGQLMTQAIALAEASDEARRQPVDFVLDEFGNLSKRIPSFGEVISACRSRGIKLHLCVQSDAQLEHVYGRELKGVIVGNIYNQMFLGTRDPEYLKQFSEQLGEYVSSGGKTMPRMTRGQLQRLEKRANETEAVILMENLAPFVATLPDYGSICPLPSMVGRETKHSMVSRLPPISRRVFDMKSHVESWESEKMKQLAETCIQERKAARNRESAKSVEELLQSIGIDLDDSNEE